MKFFIITLAIVLCQNQSVTCFSFLEFVSTKVNDIAVHVFSTLDNVKKQVKEFFSPTPHDSPDHRPHDIPTVIFKRSFTPSLNVRESLNDAVSESAFKAVMADPTALISAPQMSLLQGRPIESHVITTKDLYLITVHRLAPRLNITSSRQNVILHHGLLGSSADWILLGPENSLPYLLSDAGYDVWMVNARGNYYSRTHLTKKVESASFWKFSWQQMGEIDLAAVIDYVRGFKNNTDSDDTKIDFIGHSMGATALLVLLSSTPAYTQYIRIGILMAPLAFMSHVHGPLRAMATMGSNLPQQQLIKLVGTKEFAPARLISKKLAREFCTGPTILCCNPLLFLAGGVPENMPDAKFLAKFMYHVPSGGSTNTILHYVQLIKSGKFHRYNDVYDEFDLANITLPIALITSAEDWLSTTPDVLRLYLNLVNPVDHYIIRYRNFSHTEFVMGTQAKELVFNKVFEYLESAGQRSGSWSNEVN